MKVILSQFMVLFFLLSTLLFSKGCSLFDSESYTSVGDRSPSSLDLRQDFLSDQHLQSHFYYIFNQQRPWDLFIDAIHDHKDNFFINQALLYAFDEAIERGYDPMETVLYRELWDARNTHEHRVELLSYYITKLEDLSMNGTRHEVERANESLAKIFIEIHGLPEHKKLPFIEVIEKNQMYQTRESQRHKQALGLDLNASFRSFQTNDFDWIQFYEDNKNELKSEAFRRVGIEGLRERYLPNSMNKRYKRQNQQVVYPTTGRAGNLIGGNFPDGVWSLTYDDGPRPNRTGPILDLLDEANLKASFFWLAQNVKRHTGMVEKAKDLGMELANHSYTHANLGGGEDVSHEELLREIVTSTDTLEDYYGQEVRFFRLPYGSGVHSADIRKIIADRGLIHVFWNVDSLDWQDRNPRSVFERVKSQMNARGKGIILFHDIHPQSVKATEFLIDYIEKQNRSKDTIQVRTLEEIVEILNNAPPAEGPYVVANLNVRGGPGTQYDACTVIPQGTRVEILSRHGSFLKVNIVEPSASMRRALAKCGEETFVSGNYVQE